ncbi:MAG: hypothetical protein L0K86_08090, partial [Actinomycetia bacterium]|nr:hypothetical protein [Actinomycetes bacterium]
MSDRDEADRDVEASEPTADTQTRPGPGDYPEDGGDSVIPADESRAGTGSHRAPKSSRKLLQRLPISAALGVAALAVTGFGVVHSSSASIEDAVTAEPATLLAPMTAADPSYPRLNSPEISRSISRATLEKQAETQAKQREEALRQLSQKSEDRADELIKQKKARERREAREEAAESESDDGLAASAEAPDGAVSAGQWVLPVAGYTLTATFGETSSYWETYHTGLDFAA